MRTVVRSDQTLFHQRHDPRSDLAVCSQTVEVLPEQSVAVQVRVTVPVPQEFKLELSEKLTAGFGSQASTAAGSVKDGVAGHWIVAFAPWPESVGAVVSSIVIV